MFFKVVFLTSYLTLNPYQGRYLPIFIIFLKEKMPQQIYQIQISLKRSKPKIWRRILVPSDVLLPDLHKIILTAMGWTN